MRIGSIVWGVKDLPRAISFWSAALDYELLRDPDDDWAILAPKDRVGVQLALKLVTSDAQTHQRHHLDLYARDKAAEVGRLTGLGALPANWRYEEGADYTVLEDPDGNRFCVIEKELV
jgi:catechol 2,3-dioxygenase-like lactoylglutathione lyase family enzyme